MGRRKTSIKRKQSSENLSKVNLNHPSLREVDPLKELIDPDFTARGILECLMNNDPKGVMEIVESYLSALNKYELQRKSKLPRSTTYSALKHKNPTIKTLAKIMGAPRKTTARRLRKGTRAKTNVKSIF